jgi:hypothetical protein
MADQLTTKELALLPNAYSGSNGNFGVLSPSSGKFADKFSTKWYSCREEFAGVTNDGHKWTMPDGGFLFYHQGKTTEDIAEFIAKFESLLEVGRRKSLQRSTIQKVNTGGVCAKAIDEQMTWVIPAPFWLKQTMRFSLFTMLFRCANNGYHAGDGDFFASLFVSYGLAMGTRAAISRFLDGYTWYTGKSDGLSNGFYNTFHGFENNGANADSWKNLVRPQKKKPKPPAPSEDAILKDAPK